MNQPLRRYASAAAARGREAYVQIRVSIHRVRSLHIEPKAVWVSQATADDMRQLWLEVTARPGIASGYDGVLPSVAGVPVRCGMTGGHDYVLEYHDTRDEDHAMRDYKDEVWKVADNPLDGTH